MKIRETARLVGVTFSYKLAEKSCKGNVRVIFDITEGMV